LPHFELKQRCFLQHRKIKIYAKSDFIDSEQMYKGGN
jgi:hypothetical protein